MKNKFLIFNNELFGKIRCLIDERGEFWFCGKDIAEALQYKNTRSALGTHVEQEDKKIIKCNTSNGGGKQGLLMINESGLYSLVFGSKLPSAKKFKHWITSDLLPTLRKQNYYEMSQQSSQKLLDECNKIISQNDALKEQIQHLTEERDDLLKGIDYVSTPAPRSAIKHNIKWFLDNFCFKTTSDVVSCKTMYEIFSKTTASTGVTCNRSVFEDIMYEMNKSICERGGIRCWDYIGINTSKIRHI